MALESTLRRDRLWLLASPAGLAVLAWLYLVDMAAGAAYRLRITRVFMILSMAGNVVCAASGTGCH